MDRLFSKSKPKGTAALTSGLEDDWKADPNPQKPMRDKGPIRVPSGMGLPPIWTDEMDEFICYSEAVGDMSSKMIIAALKKKYPALYKYQLSEISIEKRLWCLDQMETTYFQKGAAIAVERREAAGHVLGPLPDYEAMEKLADKRTAEVRATMEEAARNKAAQAGDQGKDSVAKPSTPSNAAPIQAGAVRMANDGNVESNHSREIHDRPEQDRSKRFSATLRRDTFTNFREPPTPEGNRPGLNQPKRSGSTIRMPSRGIENTRPQGPVAKPAPTGLRPAGSTSSRAKDVAPAASLGRLRIPEDNSQLEGSGAYASKPAASVTPSTSSAAVQNPPPVAPPGSSYGRREGLSQSSPVNDAWNTSYGSPRTPHGRVRPVPPMSSTGSGRRRNDENLPPGAPTMMNASTEEDTTTLPPRR
ncbi:MAG: hypothetical protein Q9181_004950 [Wetmoreana brouardii]